MKFILLTIFTLVLSLSLSSAKAQPYSCDSFCVKNIVFDTSFGGQMIVSIHFSANDVDFINYPHVSAVTNLNGDTLGTGTLNLFGQVGNTTAEFPVDTDLEEIPDGFTAIVHFNYDDTFCILPYPCLTTSVDFVSVSKLVIYPNPMNAQAIISLEESFGEGSIRLYNLQGILRRQNHFDGSKLIYLHRDDLIPGLYVLVVQTGSKIMTSKLLVAD